MRSYPLIKSSHSPCAAAAVCLSTCSVGPADSLPDSHFGERIHSCSDDIPCRNPFWWNEAGSSHKCCSSTQPGNISPHLGSLLRSPAQRWLGTHISSVALLPSHWASTPLMLMPRHKAPPSAAEHHHDDGGQHSPQAAVPQAQRAPSSAPATAAGQAAGSGRLPPLHQHTYPLGQAEFKVPRKPPPDRVQVRVWRAPGGEWQPCAWCKHGPCTMMQTRAC